MHADLERLIRLQQLDATGDAARRQSSEQPEKERALQARLDEAQGLVDAARARLTDSQTQRRTVEKDLALIQGRLSKFKDQLMEVKTNREYQAMQKEIEVAQGEVKTMEDQILERMLEADGLTAAVKEAERTLAAEQSAVAGERRALEAEATAMAREAEAAAAARRDLAAEIDPRLLAIYDQVARMRKGIAMAEAKDGHCTICHVRLRPQVFNDIRRNHSIIQCDSCQRILYFVPAREAEAVP
jgi:predicted  nucleic acid-binding Zn-ribbon protein